MLYKSIAIIFFFGCIVSIEAQVVSPSVLASSGGSGENGGVSLVWTLGEGSISTLKSGELTLTQGFHQPQLLNIVGVENYNNNNNIEVSLYPNPVVASLTIKSKEDDLSYEVFDIDGIVIQKVSTFEHSTSVDFSNMAPNTYFIHILKNGKPIKIFKIEKVH